MAKTNPRTTSRQRRKISIRKRIHGTADRPRLTVFRSNQHIYAQLIDDDSGRTLAAASTLSEALKAHEGHRGNKAAAKAVGGLIGKLAIEQGVNKVVFDRNGFLYHGRIQALADGAREAGLSF
jgi:large subunit ribosomal protein L18